MIATLPPDCACVMRTRLSSSSEMALSGTTPCRCASRRVTSSGCATIENTPSSTSRPDGTARNP